MRVLITIGLTLLVGGAWAQHSSFFNIESDTDLLALPNDQLIDFDVELAAVESIVPPAHQNHELLGLENLNLPFTSTAQLPFGARLPGYERIQYAYGYQIPAKTQPKTTQLLNRQLTSTSPVSNKPLPSLTEFKTTSALNEQKPTALKEAHPSIHSTYFPPPLDFRLSLPEYEYLPPAETSIASDSSYSEVKNEAPDFPALVSGYLPPTKEFKTEPSSLPPVLFDTYLPPDPDPVIKSVKIEKTNLPTLSDGYLPPVYDFKTEPPSPPTPPAKRYFHPLSNAYLPPVPAERAHENPLVLIPLHSPRVPLVKTSGEVLNNQKQPFGVVGEHEESIIQFSSLVTPAAPTGVVGERNEPTLNFHAHVIPASPFGVVGDPKETTLQFRTQVTPAPPSGVVGERKEPSLIFQAQTTSATPFGVVGKQEEPSLNFKAEVTPTLPFGVIGEKEEPKQRFKAHFTPATPVGVIGDHKESSIQFDAGVVLNNQKQPYGVAGDEEEPGLHFSAQLRPALPFGIVGEHEESIIQFSSLVTPAAPTGVVGERNEPTLNFHAHVTPASPFGVVGDHKETTLQFRAQVTPAPPSGVVGEGKEPSLIFQAQSTSATPFGVVGKQEEPSLNFKAEVAPTLPFGVIGEKEEPKQKFKAHVTPATPVGVIGDHKDSSIHFDAEITPSPPYGIIGEKEHHPFHFKSDVSKVSPLGVVGEQKEPALKFDAKETPLKPLGVIGEPEDSPVRFSAEQTHLPAYGVIGESEHEPIKPKYEIAHARPFGVSSDIKDPTLKAHAAQSTLEPYGIIGEIAENAISALADTPSIVIGAIPKENPDCLRNTDCSEDQICMDSTCVNACVIAIGLCIGNAVCHARRHTPGCICPDMFTAITRRGNGREQYDCMPMMMMMRGTGPTITQGRVHTDLQHLAPIANHRQNFDLSPLGVLTERTQGRITTSPVRQQTFSQSAGNPCQPSPCGPNTRCEANTRGIALCRCLDDFVPDGNTINGCKPQCVTDDECPDEFRCRATKCVRVCVQGACGINAECDARNHRAICSCPSNHNGDPHIRCAREKPVVRVAPPAAPLDPCSPNPCGSNADCRVRGDRPVCTCPIGYEGDPLTNCRRGECIEANDCPGHLTCQRLKCIDPCLEGVCGTGSECTVRNHQPICSCPRGFVGDPFSRCRRFDPQELCNPSPCGQNTNCKISPDQQRAVCSCIENYIGNPLTGCRPECVTDTECPHNMGCRNNICVNPCRDACGEGAYCEVRNSRAVCSCPQYYQGDPYSRCTAECTAHDDCRSYQACFQLRCIDPCEGSCGTGANCKVEDHKPICSCPKGYTGHPFEACRPFTREDLCNPNPCGAQADCTPGFDSNRNDRPVCTCPVGFIGNPLVACQRGECSTNDECSNHEACYAYTCQNPCYTDVGSVCGENAECTVKNHQPVCSCPPGYDGNPLIECRIGRSSSFIVGRSRRK